MGAIGGVSGLREKIERHDCVGAKECSFGDAEGWDGHEYLPQGTVGCVALDQ